MDSICFKLPVSSDDVIEYFMDKFNPKNFITILTITNHELFMRLQGIKQLGPLSYYLKAGFHNRYEHSFGVAYLGMQFLENLVNKTKDLKITERAKMIFTIACLCHDLGHGPFSHTFEFAMKYRAIQPFDHEENSIVLLREIIESTKADLSENDLEIIEHMIKGIQTPMQDYPPFMFEILANSKFGVDVDKMDYLVRDSKELNLAEYSRVSEIVSNVIKLSQLDPNLHVCFDSSKVHASQLLEYRAYMFENYYNSESAKRYNALAICAIMEVQVNSNIKLLTDDQIIEIISRNVSIRNINDPFVDFINHTEYNCVVQYLKKLKIGKNKWKPLL